MAAYPTTPITATGMPLTSEYSLEFTTEQPPLPMHMLSLSVNL